MKSNIIVCATVYQVIVALQIKKTILSNTRTDLILLDTIKNFQVLAINIANESIFDSVIALSLNKLYNVGFIRGKLTLNLKKVMSINNAEFILYNYYDEFYFSSFNTISLLLGAFYLKKNKKIKIVMFEDGASSYSKCYANIFRDATNNCRKFKACLYKLLNNPILYVTKYYVFNPSVVVWDAPNVEKIPPIDTKDEEFKALLNRLFDYKSIKDSYSEKVIFLEESYYADGVDVPDVEIVNKLAEKYGKDQIFVKKHPRNPTNRFEQLGYKTNVDTSIPWEVIAMNIDLSDKIIATISSTAAISMVLMFPNANVKFFCDDIKTDNFRVNSTIEVIKRIQEVYNI